MSLLNNNNKKKKGNQQGKQQGGKSNFLPSKGKTNSKAAVRNTKLTGGSQRGS